MSLLTVNVGSSSVKLRLLDHDAVVSESDISTSASAHPEETTQAVLAALNGWPVPRAVVHRIVHGGTHFRSAVILDEAALVSLEELSDLAPAHQGRALSVIRALRRTLTDSIQVAAFDTAFHAALPPAVTTLAVPALWREQWGVRRYGFHGLSHAYASRRALELLERTHGRVVVAHLGSGCSLAATVDGHSVETTMGFTPLDGLVMASRSGSVDPALVPWLEAQHGVSSADALEALEHKSGLKGLAGTSDMREIVTRSRKGPGQPDAQLAFDVFVHRLVLGIGSMAAAAEGMDALVFTGGIGENCARVRAAAALRLRHLGVVIEPRRNAAADRDASDGDVAWGSSPCRVYVVHAREDLQMAREAAALIGPATTGP